MGIKFSILICSLEKRKKSFNELLNRLQPQLTKEVEVLHIIDSGQLTVGAKRNQLIRRAKGKYIAFVDDDDLVSIDYISKILKAIRKNPDCCGIEGNITFQGKNPTLFCHSIKYKNWFNKDGVFYRPPNHLNPVLKKIATRIVFPCQNKGEDRFYSKKIYPFLKSEEYIENPIYFYLCKKRGGFKNSSQYIKNSMTLWGDFHIEVQICINNLKNSAAGIVVNDSIFGFEGLRSGCMFVEGPIFDKYSIKYVTSKYIQDNEPFNVRIKREGIDLKFYINNNLMIAVKYNLENINIGFREMRSEMEILRIKNL